MAKRHARRGGASAPGASDKKSQSADSEEARLFRAAVRDVTPLAVDTPQGPSLPRPGGTARPRPGGTAMPRPGGTAMPRPAVRPRVPPRAPIIDSESPGAAAPGAAALGDLVAADDAPGAAAPGAADPLSFRRPGVREQTLRHLRRGRFPVEDELDLHGLSQAAARDHLAEFLAASRHAGLRCVRVVHGKGYRSGARGPVLKIAVNTWLKRHTDVLAFTSARVIDGGTGAVYVLLR